MKRHSDTDIITDLQDLRSLDWSIHKLSVGTPGCFLKAYEETSGERYYYKMSNYDSYRGVFGHECINELIVSRLLDILGAQHLHYQLIHARILVDGKEIETYITRSANFRKKQESKIAFDVFYDLHKKEQESPLEFSARMGWERYVQQMMAVDYLICNRDRHGANIEILLDEKGSARPAPLFDHGLSLLFSCYGDIDKICRYDVMEDKAVNNFIGSRSLEYNLQFIPEKSKVFEGKLSPEDKQRLLTGLEGILPAGHLEKIWEMIWKRWEHYAQI